MPRKRKSKPAPHQIRTEQLRKDAEKGDILPKLSLNGRSHTVEQHVRVDDAHLLDRLLSEHERGGAASRFSDYKSAKQAVAAIVYEHAPALASLGPYTGKREFCCRKGQTRLPMPPTLTGIVRDPETGAIYEARTDSAMLVVQGNNRKRSPYKLTDVSAYPCLLPHRGLGFKPAVSRTNRSLLKAVKQTAYYEQASPVEKAYLERCCSKQHAVASRFDPYTETLRIALPKRSLPRKTQAAILVSERNGVVEARIALRHLSQPAAEQAVRSKDDWAKLEKQFPHEAAAARAIVTRATEMANQQKGNPAKWLLASIANA